MDMITAYKYSQNTNTKEAKEFLAVNKEILLGVNEERKNMRLVWQGELLEAQCSRQRKSTCLAGFWGIEQSISSAGNNPLLAGSWRDNLGGLSVSHCHGAVPVPHSHEGQLLSCVSTLFIALQNPCLASMGLEIRAGCTKAFRDVET